MVMCALLSWLVGVSVSSVGIAALTAAFVAVGCCVAAAGFYLVGLSVAAFFYTELMPRATPISRVAVLIPAFNESALIARCVRSLRAQTYPSNLYEIVVVADNCTDDTAVLAAQAGAHRVMRRDAPDARGKGRALRWAMDQLLAEQSPPAAVVIIDADSVAAPQTLSALVERFEAGAPAAQGSCLLYGDGTLLAGLRVAAFLLVNQALPMGRAVLGRSTYLAGNGMLLSRELLLARPWDAFTSVEDLEYSLTLRSSGVTIAFVKEAIVYSSTAPTAEAAAKQQLRWEGGKAHLTRMWLPKLIASGLRQRRPALLALAFELAIPPLALLAVMVIGGALAGAGLAAAGVTPTWALAPWLAAGLAIPLYVLIGLRATHAPRSEYLALVLAPILILAKPLRAYRVLTFRADTWLRTERAAESELRRKV